MPNTTSERTESAIMISAARRPFMDPFGSPANWTTPKISATMKARAVSTKEIPIPKSKTHNQHSNPESQRLTVFI